MSDDAREDRPPADPTEKQALREALTIVLQGPLFRADAAALARTCRAWRGVLPGCPIILSISQSDVVTASDVGGWRLLDAGGAGPIDAVLAACDEIVLAPPAQALPPVKAGVGRNHVNLQIAAAGAGLARVRTPYVLRARNDLAFRDDGFLDHYLDRRRLPRGGEALLSQRVMISPWFTLDPLTLERLPFHFSDWFHLGATDDVRALWTAPPMGEDDATWYRRHAMHPRANDRERAFLSRWAVEQYLTIHALTALGRPVRLDRHDDPADAAASLAILADNFVIADFAHSPLDFAKYGHLDAAPELPLLCVNDADMVAIARAEGRVAPEAVLAGKHAQARALIAAETAAARRARSPLRRLLRRLRRRRR